MRIAIVNDMPLAVEAVLRVLATDGRHALAWIARNGAEAVEKCAADTPDLILMDLIMPVMDGVEATRRIMKASPCAILVVTATVEGNATRVYEALGAGAIDVVETPVFGKGSGFLLVKLDLLAKRIGEARASAPLTLQAKPASPPKASSSAADWLVAIGASAGGPAALATVLSGLPKDFPAAIVIVQHIDAAFAGGLITWLQGQCGLPVKAVTNAVSPVAGCVYVAAESRHVVVDCDGRLALVAEDGDGIYVPGIDVLFETMAANWRKSGTGVLLTGMGRDGARGLLELRRAGFVTLAQDRESSAVYGMPKAAAELDAATHIFPLASISSHLRQLAYKPEPRTKR